MPYCTCQYNQAKKWISSKGLIHNINCNITRTRIWNCLNYGLSKEEICWYFKITANELSHLKRGHKISRDVDN